APAGLLGALSVPLRELALGAVLEPADGGDHQPHDESGRLLPASAAARPHLFKIVEGAHLRPEHMNDDVAGIDQHPVAVLLAFDSDTFQSSLVQAFDRAV